MELDNQVEDLLVQFYVCVLHTAAFQEARRGGTHVVSKRPLGQEEI
jgi:hypothetical protein